MRFPRLAVVCLLILAAGPFSAAAQEVTLDRVWPGYRDAASFTRLGEYFGAGPDATNHAALRTQPEARAGYYWLLRTASASAQPGCTLTLEVRRAGRITAETHTFKVNLPAGSHPFHAGLTGADWPDPAELPVAWRLSLHSPDANLLASAQSFLWDHSSS